MSKHVVPLFVGGAEYIPATTFPVVSPATGNVIHHCGLATESDAKKAVDAAGAAFASWQTVGPSQRRDLLLRAAEVMEARRPELAKYMADEVAAPDQWAQLNLDTAIDFIKDVAGRISSLAGIVPVCSDPGLGAMVWKEAYGVVLAMAPWNAPYILGVRSVLCPIAAGNTVVLKGSELSPRVFWAIASVFHEAGLPKGVLNFIATGRANAAAVTTALIANPLVRKVNFTGSTAVGSIIAKLAGEHLKPLVLELGGKAPAIVWEDADLDVAVEECVRGSFQFSGQVCMSTERVVVHSKISRRFQEKLVAKIAETYPSTADAPVVINRSAVDKVQALLKDAVSKGGSVLCGEMDTDDSSGTKMRPVVVSKVSPDMDLYRTESFGPSLSLIEVESEEEAVRIANDTEYGLTAAVFTRHLPTGLRFAKGIESGAVHINSMTIHDESALPHGGVKSSGYGRFNTTAGLEEWVRTKTVTWRA